MCAHTQLAQTHTRTHTHRHGCRVCKVGGVSVGRGWGAGEGGARCRGLWVSWEPLGGRGGGLWGFSSVSQGAGGSPNVPGASEGPGGGSGVPAVQRPPPARRGALWERQGPRPALPGRREGACRPPRCHGGGRRGGAEAGPARGEGRWRRRRMRGWPVRSRPGPGEPGAVRRERSGGRSGRGPSAVSAGPLPAGGAGRGGEGPDSAVPGRRHHPHPGTGRRRPPGTGAGGGRAGTSGDGAGGAGGWVGPWRGVGGVCGVRPVAPVMERP